MARVAPPIRRIAGNLIFNRDEGDVWAVYRVAARSYRSEPERHKASLVGELENFARTAEADFQVLRVTHSFDADTYATGLMEHVPPRAHRGLWGLYVQDLRERLAGLQAHYPAVFLSVRLADPGQDMQERASRLLERTPREIVSSVRRRQDPHMILARSHATESRVISCLDAQPATAPEIQWLIRRSLCRGIGEPRESRIEDDSIVRWLSEHGVDHQYRHLRVTTEHGDSFQTGVCLGEMDHAQAFSRQAELMFTCLEEHPWPIDACLSVRYVRNAQARRQLYHQFARKANQLKEEELATHGAMDDSLQRVTLAREYHGRLSATGEPMLMGTLSFVLSADSEQELGRRVQHLKEAFPWDLYRPYGDQLDLWASHLPGQRCRVRGFERPFTPEQVGAMVPHATHEAGSRTPNSLYVAKTLFGRQPVLLDLREAAGTDRPPTIALEASLGGGKTMLLQLLYFQAFLQGHRIVDIDPKGDHRFHLLPEVAPNVNVIVLGPDPEHRGKLDPLRVAPVNERQDTAVTFLVNVLPRISGKEEAMIHGAVGRTLDRYGDRACCVAVIEELERGTEAERAAAEMLRQYCGHGIVQLGFARLDDPLPARASEQVTYLNVRALRTPGHLHAIRSEMSPAERHGAAMVQLVALYAMRIAQDEPSRVKVLGFDEAYMLSAHAVGRQLIDQWTRWARSENGVPILSSQNVQDLAPYQNLIGITFLGAMQSREDAEIALASRDLDKKGPLTNALCERYGRSPSTKGQFLLHDLRGHCEEIQTDPGDRLLEALSTTPVEDEPVSEIPEVADAEVVA